MRKQNVLGISLLASTVLMGAGSAFADTNTSPDPATAETPLQVELQPRDVSAEVPVTPTPDPDDPDNPGGGDDITGITGSFGIAYAPASLVAKDSKVELQKGSTQTVELKSSKEGENNGNVVNLNVGVRDTTSDSGREWSLKAQLVWNSNSLSGSSIKATGAGEVTENDSGNLSSTTKVENNVVDNLKIGTDNQTTIMTAKKDRVMSGTYN